MKNIILCLLLFFSSLVFSDSKDVFYTGRDGQRQHAILFYSNEVAPQSALFFIHGMQSHAEWLRASGVGEALAERGILVFAYDRRGSGQSASTRGHADNPAQLMNDMTDALRVYKSEVFKMTQMNLGDDLELHAMANCFGVRLLVPYIVAAQEQALSPFASVTYIAPSTHMTAAADYSFAQKMSLLLKKNSSYVATPLSDELFVSSGKGLDWIRNDVLGLRKVTVSFLKTVRKLTKIMDKNIYDLRIPMMVIVAEDDVMVDSQGVYDDLYLGYAGPKKFVKAPGEHSLEFGLGRETLIEATVDWLLGSQK